MAEQPDITLAEITAHIKKSVRAVERAAAKLKKNAMKRLQEGAAKSNVGKLERITQNRVVALFQEDRSEQRDRLAR